jgi:hypothetical protein
MKLVDRRIVARRNVDNHAPKGDGILLAERVDVSTALVLVAS